MRITRVFIERFRAIEKIELRFDDLLGQPRHIVTMAGPNGSGKTSVLYAITNALRGVLGFRTDDVPVPNQDDIRNGAGSSSGWTSTPSDVRVEVDIYISPEEQDDIRKTLRLLEKGEPPALPLNTLTVEWVYPPRFNSDGEREPWHHASVTPSVHNVRSWLLVKSWAIKGWQEGKPGISEMVRKLGGLFFFPQDRDLRSRVVGLPHGESLTTRQTVKGKRSVHDVLDDFSRRFSRVVVDDPDNWESLVKRLYSLVCSPRQYEGFLYKKDTLVGSPIFSDGVHQYPLSHAASGEHVILEYIIELCRYGPLNRSIVLVDEPEVHLHPLWLRRLYLSLPKVGDDNQFILTTHSPELRERAAADNALVELGQLDKD